MIEPVPTETDGLVRIHISQGWICATLSATHNLIFKPTFSSCKLALLALFM